MTPVAPETGIRTDWCDDDVLVVTFARPASRNAITLEMRDAWLRELAEIEQSLRACRVVVVTGEGAAFSAGGDIHEMREFLGDGADAAVREVLRFQEMCRLVLRLPVPVIAAVNGHALGGGTAVALMSDLRIATDETVFGVGQLNAGIVPDIGLTYLLPRIVGTTRAFELMMMDRHIDAETALEWGLVNKVVPADLLLETAVEWAQALTAKSEPALRWIKRVTYLNLDSSFEHALNLEAMALGILVGTPEFASAIDRFLSRG